jgi:4-amino-4-deoxy-L-arabinose transferase-like glycosyltransferase
LIHFLKNRFVRFFMLFIFIELMLLMYIKLGPQPSMVITADGKLYYNLAENLVNGNGLINTIRQEDIIVPPLFALILVPFVFLFNSAVPFIVFQYILFAMNGVYTSYLAEKLFNSRITGLLTGLIYAIHPVLLLNGPQYLLTETIFISFLLMVLHLAILWLREPDNWKTFTALIFILSLSLLFRPHLLFMFPVILLFAGYFLLKKMQSWKSLVAFSIPVALLLINGWYNYHLHDEFVPLENYSGMNLYIANNPETEIGFYNSHMLNDYVGPLYHEVKDVPLSEKSEILKKEALDYIFGYPIDTAKRVIAKFFLFFKGIYLIDWMTIIGSAVGLIWAYLRMKEQRVVWLFLLLYILGFAALTSAGLLVGGQRYRTPIIPVYLPFTAFLITQLLLMTRHRNEN